MTSRPKKYGFAFLCSMIFFTVIFAMVFAGLSGGFISSEPGDNTAAILGAIPISLGISFLVSCFVLLMFVCQEEGA